MELITDNPSDLQWTDKEKKEEIRDAKEFEKARQAKMIAPSAFEQAMNMAGMKKRAKAFANYKG